QQGDERLAVGGRGVRVPQLGTGVGRGQPRRAGGQDAARHRGERRGKGHCYRRGRGHHGPFGRKGLFYFGDVPVRAGHLIRRHRPHNLGGQQVRPGRAAGAGGAGGGHDHDVGRLNQAGRQQRGQGQDGRGGVAAGGGHPGRRLDGGPGGGQFG